MSDPAEPVSPAPTPQPSATPKVAPYVDTSSPNNVRVWIRKSIAEGRLKDCANLNLYQVDETVDDKIEGKNTYSFFVPRCDHRSFISIYGSASDERQDEFLRASLSINPISCPKNCSFYENRRWAAFKSALLKPFLVLGRSVRAAWKGYAGLPWQTQVTLIAAPALILILWKAPNWVPQIIALAKALWGK